MFRLIYFWIFEFFFNKAKIHMFFYLFSPLIDSLRIRKHNKTLIRRR